MDARAASAIQDPLPPPISQAIHKHEIKVAGVLSGNRNFEGRIHPDIGANYLASPMLVVAYALAGSMRFDFATQSLGKDKKGKPVFLKDIWPSNKEIAKTVNASVSRKLFQKRYSKIFTGDAQWKAIRSPKSQNYRWQPKSTYVRKPPFFENMPRKPQPVPPIKEARILALLGDSITSRSYKPRRLDQDAGSRSRLFPRSMASSPPSSTPMARGAAIMR